MADRPTSLPGLLVSGLLEADLAALVWLLAEGGSPVLVAGPGPRTTRARVLDAVALVRPGATVWPTDLDRPESAPSTGRAQAAAGLDIRRYLILARDGRTVGATIEGGDLEAVFGRLEGSPIGLARDELGHLGVVLVLGPRSAVLEATDPDERVIAAHWIRPVARDGHGHVQRLPPAVLGAWDARRGHWDDFSWGVMPELAARLGRRAGELERERERRAAFLTALATAGVVDPADVLAASSGYALGGASMIAEE